MNKNVTGFVTAGSVQYLCGFENADLDKNSTISTPHPRRREMPAGLLARNQHIGRAHVEAQSVTKISLREPDSEKHLIGIVKLAQISYKITSIV
jgi:hypothetical protein